MPVPKEDEFQTHYKEWRDSRLKKLLSLTEFKNKTVLELGCGHGDIGLALEEHGAIVTYAEGREEHLVSLRQLGKDVVCLNQEESWNLNRTFDIVIHFGVLYHLKNWKQDLKISLAHAKETMFLESLVTNSSNPEYEVQIEEPADYDQSMIGIGSRVSASHIESVLTPYQYQRFDDPDLDSGAHQYSWIVNKNFPEHCWGEKYTNYRRFWMIKISPLVV